MRTEVPTPGVLSSAIDPPISSTRRFEMARPRPVPPRCLDAGASACTNGWKRRAWSSGEMPMPVSVTVISSCSRPARSPRRTARIATLPVPVNLTALPARFRSTCRRRTGSQVWAGAISGSTDHSSVSPFCLAASAKVIATLRTTSGTEAAVRCRLRCPASTLEMSSTSFRMRSSDCDEALITPSISRCSQLVVPISSSSAMPRMAFIGVRISWLIAARNAVFARLARSAWSRASRSRCSASTSGLMSTQ